MKKNKIRVKRAYYVLYQSSKGIDNTVIHVEGGIRSVGILQGLIKKLSEMNGGEEITLLNWKHLPEDDEIMRGNAK